MKANELRIGNWMQSLKEDSSLSMYYNVVKLQEDNTINSGIINYLPIPIDEFWLIKFGFELYDYELSTEDDDFIFKDYKKALDGKTFYYTICECPDCEWDFGVKLTWANQVLLSKIKYVHQLQNLYFALTGEELEIK